MTSQRCGEEDAEAILSNLKMEGRVLSNAAPGRMCFCSVHNDLTRGIRKYIIL